MTNIFNSIFNALVRDVNPTVKVFIGIGFFMFATFCLVKSIRKKNDTDPLALGWMMLCIICMLMVVVYAMF